MFREDVCAWKHVGRCRLWNPEDVPCCGCSLWDRSNTPLMSNCFPCVCFHLLRLQTLVPVLAALIILKWSATVWWFKALLHVRLYAVISGGKHSMQNSKLPKTWSRVGGEKGIVGCQSDLWMAKFAHRARRSLPEQKQSRLKLNKTNI